MATLAAKKNSIVYTATKYHTQIDANVFCIEYCLYIFFPAATGYSYS